ncbi:MAG: DUF2764 domain-containing protein [Victivallales bacterium]|jgi:hypothetical protein|nr:DUF2764 domain-containing protein [Victivallales bacterium]
MYYFFLASLPTLGFDRDFGMSIADFDALAAEQMSPAKLAQLQSGSLSVSRASGSASGLPRAYADYTRFEQYLRTRIAERRAGKDEDHAPKLPEPELYFSEVDTALSSASAISDPLEREKQVDRIRWRYLDELEIGHEFDFDNLCVYRLRLEILNKYRNRNGEIGKNNFNAAIERVAGIDNATP